MGAEAILIISVALIAYTYVGYPVLVFLLSRLFARPVRRADITPMVSVIITAYNEERDIAAKIENTLALDYPKEKLEIIVASDCSSDRTDEIVRGYARQGVLLRRWPRRMGKTMAQHQAMRASSGDILVLSDATTLYQRDVLRQLMPYFADPEVGCVGGRLIYVDRSDTAVGRGCRSYWSYEGFLKRRESRLGSLVGVSGCLYAVRRSCQAWLPYDLIDDFAVATEIHLQGLRTVYAPEAISTEDTNQRGQDEFRMRVRVVEQSLRTLLHYREALSLRRQGMFAFQMVSHKLLRYAVPIFLIAACASNWLVTGASGLYRLAFLGQMAFYSAALLGWCGDRVGGKLGPRALPYYFALVNAASLVAVLKCLSGGAHIVWEPVREPSGSRPELPGDLD